MTTIDAVNVPRRPLTVGAYDRVVYSGMAIAMALTVLVGFGPTYYLRSLFGAPPTVTGASSLTTLAHVHAAVFTAWVLLFIVQTALVASHRIRVHQRIGIAGGVLAASMVVVGASTAIAAAARGAAPPGADPLAFLAVPLVDIALFAVFVAGALARRRQRETHKRLMLLAYISIMAAAVARIPGMLPLGPFVFFGVTLVFLLAGIVYDLLSRGRIHPTYIWGGVLLAVSVPGRLMMSGTETWREFAQILTR